MVDRQPARECRAGLRTRRGQVREGLTSTVEFGQAQLARLEAQINHTTAGYEYQIQRLILEFQVGGERYLRAAPAPPRSPLTGIVP